jgi:chromosome segregation ATPase
MSKMLSSNVSETEMLFSKIDEARELAERLEKLSEAVESATRERDSALYKFFARLHYLEKRLRRLNTPREKLEAKYGRLPASSKSAIKFMLKLTYPNLGTKQRSKYAAVLQYVREKKKPDQSVKSLIRRAGGINLTKRQGREEAS